MFKRYDQKQQFLLPFNLEEFVPENHIARVLNDIIDVVNIDAIESTYSEEGCPAYHPRLLLKILLYGSLISIRSSRNIDQMVTIQPLIKKVCFSAKCCNPQDNSGAPLSTARIASITFMPFFLIEDMYALILQKATAPSMLRKVPEIFCCSFIILMSRSA